MSRYSPFITALWVGSACSQSDESPDTPTYYRDVLPIFNEACVGCHTPDSPAPFAIDDYEEAAGWGPAIKSAVQSHSMPPYGIDNSGACQTFVDVPTLSGEQIDTIARWVDAGTPEGDPALREPPPILPSLKGTIVEAAMAQPYTPIGGETPGSDEYRCIPLTPGLLGGEYITGFEVIPGDSALVHHVVIHAVDPTSAEAIPALEAEDGRPGWDCFFGGGVSGDLAAIWTPGGGVVRYPDGMGLEVAEGSVLVAEMHYFQPDGTRSDLTRIRVSMEETVPRRGALLLADDFFMTGATLPPGRENFEVEWSAGLESLLTDGPGLQGLSSIPESVDIYGIFPHMHELGAIENIHIEGSNGSTCVGDLPHYDFEWQRLYFYDQPIKMYEDDTMHVTCGFDTRSRSEPTPAGAETTQEMCSIGLFVEYPSEASQEDENTGDCQRCSQVAGPGSSGAVDVESLCTDNGAPSSRELYESMWACICEDHCAEACGPSFCADAVADEDCVACLRADCEAESDACAAD